jgi:hypothetical protein
MTSSRTPRSSRGVRRTAAALAVTVVAAGATTLTSALIGVGPSTAAADPGDTYVPTGSSQLVQSEDLQAIQSRLDTEKVVLNRDGDFSSCLGEGSSWTQVLPGSPKPVTGTWTRRKHQDQSLYESIAQAKTVAEAKRWEKTLVSSGIRACRTPVYDFHYGPVQSSGIGSGHATWAVSYRGDEKLAEGGVAVVPLDKTVGFVQVNGTWAAPAGQTMESVAKLAVDRLG